MRGNEAVSDLCEESGSFQKKMDYYNKTPEKTNKSYIVQSTPLKEDISSGITTFKKGQIVKAKVQLNDVCEGCTGIVIDCKDNSIYTVKFKVGIDEERVFDVDGVNLK